MSFAGKDEVTEIPGRSPKSKEEALGQAGEITVEGNEGSWSLEEGEDRRSRSPSPSPKTTDKPGLEITVPDTGEPVRKPSTPQKEVGGEDLLAKLGSCRRGPGQDQRCQRALDRPL